jgi:hypothetical protein
VSSVGVCLSRITPDGSASLKGIFGPTVSGFIPGRSLATDPLLCYDLLTVSRPGRRA